MSKMTDAVIVGAGPYGLSVAAQARSLGLSVRVFGTPMSTWAEHMPAGMYLKSEPWASDLSDAAGRFTLQAYCAERGETYAHAHPVPVDQFVAYGRWFADRAQVGVEDVRVVRVGRQGSDFVVELANGETIWTRSVVLAVGVVPFAFTPPALADLPEELGGHCSRFHDLSPFAGKDVTVVGGGQSAIETAALLAEAGATTRMVARTTRLAWNDLPPPERRPFAARLRAPQSGLGNGWGNWTYAERPGLVRHLPDRKRMSLLHSALGPAGSWWLKDRFTGHVQTQLGTIVTKAEPNGDAVRLTVAGPNGRAETVETERVVVATGYVPDLDRLTLLDPSLRQGMRKVGPSPRLGAGFESSVPGLYFVGLMATLSYGPVQRFVCGTGYAARQVSRRLRQRAAAGGASVSVPTPAKVPAAD